MKIRLRLAMFVLRVLGIKADRLFAYAYYLDSIETAREYGGTVREAILNDLDALRDDPSFVEELALDFCED